MSAPTSAPGPGDDHGVFEAHRARLVGLAYRITGSRAEADDVVQDAWLRWQGTDRSRVENPPAWLTTVTSRLALDHLRSARVRREAYVGPWLPEAATAEPGPDERAEVAESVTVGFLAVLERLGPVERVVFLLADVFGVPFDEISTVVDRSPEACRQVASRARRRVREGRPRYAPTDAEAWRVTEAFLGAAAEGDMARLVALLAPDAVLTSDGGPHHRAARLPVEGAERVARFVLNITQRIVGPDVGVEVRAINGQPGVVVRAPDGTVLSTLAVSVVDGRVDRVWALVNPDKTASLAAPPIR
ncbi:MAG TPA: RNA polymerase sigma factor SigJ [Acidimicrobiales bacterium]|nr:RNA polymerase sigma factor SigJ [Acidimicrobiales bacterium]